MHLRHPSATVEETARIIETIPPRLYARLSLHDHHPLAIRFGLGGIHLNSRNSEPAAGFSGMVSRSCHSIVEIAMHDSEYYLFLSPIYDSISKAGYRAAYGRRELAAVRELLAQRVVALGGVTPCIDMGSSVHRLHDGSLYQINIAVTKKSSLSFAKAG